MAIQENKAFQAVESAADSQPNTDGSRTLFDLSPVGITQISAATGKFVRVNAKFCELIGYTAQELMSLTHEDITYADDRAGGAAARQTLLKGDLARYDREKRYVNKNSTIIWVQANSTLLRDAQGEPDKIITVFQDITAHKQVEEKLRDSEKRLQLAIRAGDLGIWETNSESGQRRWTTEAMAMFGLELPDRVGRFGGDHDELHSILHPEDRHLHDQYHRDLREVGSIKSEYRIVLPKGGIRWISGGASVLTRDDTGVPIRSVHIAADITQRKLVDDALDESMKQFRQVVMSVAVPIMLHADDGTVLLVNHMWTQLTGYRLQDIPTFKAWTLKAYGEEPGQSMEQMDNLFRADTRQDIDERTVTTSTGDRRLWHFSSTPMGRDAEGRRLLISAALDVTEQRRFEQALVESQQFTRNVLDNLFAFVGVVTPDGILIEANRAPLDAAGIPASDVIGKKFWDCYWWSYSTDLQAQVRDWCDRVARGDIVRRDVQVRMAGDTRMWIDFQFAPLRDVNGRITHLIPSAMDISGRREAQDMLLAREERFRSLVTATTQIVWTAAADGAVVEDSPTWRAFTWQTHEQWLGWGWANAVHPDDREATMALWRETFKATAVFETEYRLKRHDGQYRWMMVRAVPVLDRSGDFREWVGTNTDITDAKRSEMALRESEERFRSFADSIPQLAWIADAGSEGNIGWVNKVLLDFAGKTQEEMRGLGWRQMHHPDHVERVTKKFAHHVKHSLDWEDTFPLRRKDGEYRWFLSRMKCIQDDKGKVIQIFGTNTDVTNERQLEEKLRLVADDLFTANRRKDVFLATLAHELRNPLAPIRNGLQLMKLSGVQNDSVEQARAMMERQLSHMVRLVDDLMDASRINQGKLELRKQPISLMSVLNTAIESSSAPIQHKRHHLIVKHPEQALMVDADLTRLAQVFQNLLNNAAKYSEQGGQIHLTVDTQGSDATVTITDTGVGIAADQLPHIFEMFTQVGRSLEMAQGGLGIGLSLVKQLVDMHGGKVEAESAGLGRGSKFVVTLPLLALSTHSGATGNDDVQTEPASSLRILVVDDNRDSADSLSEMLELMGNDTRAAYDGQQGIDMASEFRPDVILFDIGMPKLNGYEACRLVRQQPWGKDIVLIAATGWGQEEDRNRTRAVGFNYHFVKPVDPQELVKMLSDLSIARK